MHCTECGTMLDDGARFCPNCGKGVNPGVSRERSVGYPEKEMVLSILLSVILIGLGQIYLGRVGRGLAFLVGAIILGGVSFLLPFGLIFTLLLWVYNIYDAYKLTNEYNDSLRSTGNPPW